MESTNISLSVDDTSPSISYSPLGDTFSTVNLTAGWNPYFSESGFLKVPDETGIGTSLHATSLDEAALSIKWRGTGIRLLGYTTAKAGYDITLDGKPQLQSGANIEAGVLATFLQLPDTEHNVSLSARIPIDDEPGASGVYFDNAVIISTVDSLSTDPFQQQSLYDRNISFLGNWSIRSNPNDPNAFFHHSITRGDVAQVTFSGASFLLIGATSSKAGTYSVTLDNVTSTFSGRSSFTNLETQLFFSTSLDPTELHNFQVTNDDGNELSLKVGGLEAFAAGPPTTVPSPPPSTVPLSGSASHPKGTIAALVLAGILGFLVISGSLFFFFVIRPRRRRVRQARLDRHRRKEQEAGGFAVINIAPSVSLGDVELGSTSASPGHRAQRSSGKSGFTRWKREMEGGVGGLGLGISFRHSGSIGKKSAGRSGGASERLSPKSSMFTMSSRLSSKRGKGKRKAMPKHVSESSWSPSFALELSARPESIADSYKDKDVGPSYLPQDEHISVTSGLTSLSYMNTPSLPPPAAQFAPPSYSTTSSERDSHSNSVSPAQFAPRCTSLPSSNAHSRQGSVGLLLNYGENNPGSPEEDPTNSYEPFISSDPAHHLSPLAPRDRGSAQYSSDDTTSYLGSTAARLALRGLSPRTSEFAEPERATQEPGPPTSANDSTAGAKSAGIGIDTPRSPETSFLEVISPVNHPIELQANNDRTLRLPDTTLPDIRSTSPFIIDLAEDPLRNPGEAGRARRTREHRTEERGPEKRQSPRDLRSVFQLTPLSNAPVSPPHGHMRSQSASFLDFSSSSDGSNRTRSIAPSEISAQNRQRQLQSRWSSSVSQMTGHTRSGSSDASIPVNSPASGSISYFPYPISLPPSPHHPEGHISSPPSQAISRRLEPPQARDRYPARALRLSAFGSPTDSVPISVAEPKNRNSGSTGDSNSAHTSLQLPPHPPLPDINSIPRSPSP
ncbi:hypothetical protein FPV67DRAFT_1667944 [Lyophyllum atratum]|nr:hypothetical protein FPV67DRAFT_1667944 [Lyophyllum atratum]